MVEVFREVRRVLKPSGTLWLNLGDSYASNPASGGIGQQEGGEHQRTPKGPYTRPPGLKPKDLIGIPWRVAFALQSDGWWLRQDIIWHKPNPMPESVTDRCTKSHEYIFLMTKSAKYWYDAEAIREENVNPLRTNYKPGKEAYSVGNVHDDSGRVKRNDGFQAYADGKVCEGRNKRDVWTVATAPFKGAHFATFPPKLIEPCILAGCPKGGVVLDPFIGSGTTGMVAVRNGRDYVGVELNPEYAEMAEKRIAGGR
jgi:DNA modification methylase